MIENLIINFLLEISPEVMRRFNGNHDISIKPDDSIVTDSDKHIEGLLKDKFSKILPDSYFLGEESSDQDEYGKVFDNEYIWAIDPIDGTVNFASGIPFFAVSVGLLKKGADGHKPVAGAVLFPALNEMFYSRDNKSYSMQLDTGLETELQKPESESSVVMLTDSFYRYYDLVREVNNAQPRQVGCTVANIAYTAIGRSMGTMTAAHLWDFAASLAIAKNLGVDMRKYSDGTVKDSFSVDDFIVGNQKSDWRMKEMYVISTQNNYALMKQVMKEK